MQLTVASFNNALFGGERKIYNVFRGKLSV